MATQPKRVTLVADEMLGYVQTGGIGTATTFLAVALARMGHEVELLYVGDPPDSPLSSDLAGLYEGAGVGIRLLERSDAATEPSYFARARDTELALRSDPPDVVITQDLAAPAYTALRMRQLGLAFEETVFVVYCHGTRRWITDMARKVRVLPGALAITVLEQASVELADVVVSPSRYVLDWMRGQGWQLPQQSVVIPYFSRSAATGEAQPRADGAGERIERVAFFGRLEERKGLRPFAAGLSALDPELLRKVELEFVGAATPAWPPDRVTALLSESARAALRGLSFATDLDQPAALAHLSRPGTLAVMPSLGETFSNAVYECLERGIPFISSDAGAPAELVAPEDRARVLFEPTAEGVEAALRRALSGTDALRPALPAFAADTARERWAEVIWTQPRSRPRAEELPSVTVAVIQTDPNRDSPCRSALERQRYSGFSVRVETSRAAALQGAGSDWIVFLDGDDVPREDFLDKLVRAQSASDADVVTCGIELGSGIQRFFLGDPGGLGLLANHYGTAALIRRSLLTDASTPWPVSADADWPLFARLALTGAQIVSIPEVLVGRRAPPGDLRHHPSDGLIVLQEFERHLTAPVRSLARLAAGLAAEAEPPSSGKPSRLSRLLSRR